MKQYFKNIIQTSSSLLYGLKITMRHFWQARTSRTPVGVEDKTYFEQKEGIVTLQYPFEQLPVPDTGRYQLHNEIDDCIVCDKCAKICPVNCIDIEPVRAVEEIGKTSDGTSKRIYAAKFDIDMSKCCFCGLCTVVCPTECLTMTKDYDFSVFDLKEHNFEFGDMSPEMVAEKKTEFEVHAAEKEKAKAAVVAAKAAPEAEGSIETMAKPKTGGFKPKVKATSAKLQIPKNKKEEAEKQSQDSGDKKQETKAAKPVFKPKVKPVVKRAEDGSQKSEGEDSKPKAQGSKPVFKPKVKSVVKKTEDESPKSEEAKSEESQEPKVESPKAKKPVFRPKIKPKKKD
ncbi:NADH-quinone oxidoreductase subunit I [Reichenbachiella faecimaris]|uniref:NADH-quinone oxidoreductase subunit I n=1 Tax=Reichenbachiella faecimaris TaxID=692418 RepID=A0A1W2G9E9_REIFA|nr:4Fe-4S binding protein [Reichenbachiella faecimaris]SMD32968.1 NADH-quinone oxidoreductase subunit I [Reichenbachiella faecimaris]